MEQDDQEKQVSTPGSSHTWLTPAEDREEDFVDEVIRYTLDEIRLA